MSSANVTEEPALAFTRADVDQTVPARFEQVVRQSGGRVALTGGGRRWTYAELNGQANRVAHAISARTGRGPGCVAFMLEQSPEMVVATLGVLKAGKAYLALHPGMPSAAQAAIVRDAAPELIVTRAALARRAHDLVAGASEILALEDIGEDHPTDNPEPSARPDDPATVFFTSGTTGRPKGVVRSHRVVLHRAWLTTSHESITPSDRQSLLTHCSFGASQADLAGALLNGAALCVFDVTREGLTALAAWLDREQITLFRPPVQLFRTLLASLEPERRFPTVRLVSLGGDLVLPDDLERWKRHFVRPCVVLHRFSTTETTLLALARIDHDTPLTHEAISAGTPVADKELALVGSNGQPVPVGEAGELVVTSTFLADGYWRRPEETARVFTTPPGDPARRSYRTGDVGRFLPDGRFLFLGRADHQVKIRGYRVDIGQVEAALRQLDDVSETAVVAVKEAHDRRLVGFVVMRPGLPFDPASLRLRLRRRLPDWSIPAHIHAVRSLPTTAGGKIDRQRLSEQAHDLMAGTGMAGAPPGPAEELEGQIAAIFQRILRCAPVNRSDDFFLLGGDSLQATVLHQQLEHFTGLRIPLEALVKNATVSGIAETLGRVSLSGSADASARRPVLVPLRAAGSQPALFLVHGRMGQAFASPHVLEVLGDDQPVYAFQASGLDRSRLPANTVEGMASEYVRAMRQVQPAGPYLLGAACAGGLVAVEMANQLREAGERVGPLVLIDPPVVPIGDRSWWHRSRVLLRLRLRRLVLGGSLERRVVGHLRKRAAQGRIALDPGNDASLSAAASVVLDFEMARLKYRRWRYDGPVLLLRSAARLGRDGPARRGKFSRHLTGDVRWFDVGGTHTDVRGVGNQQMATRLREAVTIAQDALADAGRRA